MEPRANRPPPLAPSIPIRPAAGADSSSLQLTSSSTTSSSSSSTPDFIRHINAAFKHRRPLGIMNVSRASRVLVPAADPSNRAPAAAAAVRVGNVGMDVRKEGAAEAVRGGTSEDSSITPPSVTETGEGLAADRNVSLTPETVTTETFGGAGQRPGALLPERVPGGGNAGLDFQRREGQLRGHEGEIGVDNPGQPQGTKLSVASSSFENREELRQDQHYVQPVIRSSVAGATCATTMSLHTGPTYQCTRASAAQTSCVTQMSSNAPCIHEAQGVAQKEGDGVQDHREVAQLGGDLKDKGVSGNLPARNSVPAPNGSSPPPKTDKASRKKKYDPDMFFKVNGKRYQKLGKIGSGGSSEVYKVISTDCNIYALKKIKLKGRDYPTAFGFCQEIEYLNRLKGKGNIIQLIDYEVTDKFLLHGVQNGSTMSTREGRIKDDQYIYMVLEYGEIDLAHMLSQKWKEMDGSSWKMDENWLRFYWQQMLEAVNTIHEERIVHSDLKPANFLLVRGSLKLIDFGIAKAIMTDTTNIQRDAQVGTLNYMSPEAFMWNEHDASGNTIKCGRSSDIWSLGCILYQMVYGKTPFAEYKNFWAKFKVITDKNHEIEYEPVSNPWLIDLMRRCLAWERNERWRIPQLLQHPFLVPPMPGESLLNEDHPSKLLMEKAGIYWNDPEVSRICYELHKTVANLEQRKKDQSLLP